MITVATRYNLDEAFLLRSHLEGSGIAAFIPDEFIAQNDWAWITAIGGIRIQVAEEDAAAARELLDSVAPVAVESPPLHCPYCRSASVAPDDLSRRIALGFLLLFTIPLPFFKMRYQCSNCGRNFHRAKTDHARP